MFDFTKMVSSTNILYKLFEELMMNVLYRGYPLDKNLLEGTAHTSGSWKVILHN